jgi:hypothetical protein
MAAGRLLRDAAGGEQRTARDCEEDEDLSWAATRSVELMGWSQWAVISLRNLTGLCTSYDKIVAQGPLSRPGGAGRWASRPTPRSLRCLGSKNTRCVAEALY